MSDKLSYLQRKTQYSINLLGGISMPARQSAEVQQAMKLHLEQGKSIYEAAAAMGIWPSTLYRALFPKGKKKARRTVDKRIA